jgi:hypothetical protein
MHVSASPLVRRTRKQSPAYRPTRHRPLISENAPVAQYVGFNGSTAADVPHRLTTRASVPRSVPRHKLRDEPYDIEDLDDPSGLVVSRRVPGLGTSESSPASLPEE